MTNAKRQASFRSRQKAKGLVLVQKWVSEEKADAVRKAMDEAAQE